MLEANNIDSSKFILAGDAKFPEWVLTRINNFTSDLYQITAGASDADKDTLNLIIKSFTKNILPPNMKLTKRIDKRELGRIIDLLAEILDDNEFVWYNWLILNAGFFLSSVIPISIDEDSLTVPDEIQVKRKTINKRFEETQDKYQYNKDLASLAKEVLDWLTEKDNPVADFINSGANGSVTHIQELLVGLGFAINTKGEITDTITNCLVEGVSQTDYFSNSSQGISALYSKSNETSKPGYLGKKLSNICEKVKLGQSDCGSTNRLRINTDNKDFLTSFIGLHFSTTKGGSTREFTKNDVTKNISTDLFFRSPLHCKANNMFICKKCYSQELIRNHNMKENTNIGLFASTGLTNTLVGLTLKKSHVGVSLNLEEVDLTKEIISQ